MQRHAAGARVLAGMVMLVVGGMATAADHRLEVIADAYVSSEYPDTNYGADATLFTHAGSNTKRSYLRFDLGAIPRDEVVTGGTLHLLTDGGLVGTLVDAHHVASNAWQEQDVTWRNRPGGEPTAFATAGVVHGWMNWILPASLLRGVDRGEFSVLLKLQDEGESGTVTFYSREALIRPAEAPYLVLQTAPVPEPHAVVTMLVGLGLLAAARLTARRTA